MLKKVVWAGGESTSFVRAQVNLKELAGISVSHTLIADLTQMIGDELLAERDRQAQLHKFRQLSAETHTPPDIACVLVDGGRIHTRAPGPRGVHEPQWKETKVGCLWNMTGPIFDADPHPQVPRCFLDREHVGKMVREMKNARQPHPDTPPPAATALPEREADTPRAWPPERKFRTCVATLRDVYGFGPLVAAEAQRRGFYEAPRQVFLGDGDSKNWTVHNLHFRDFVAITDFVHPVGYLYEAATAITNSAAAQWEQCRSWITEVWSGRVDVVLEELRVWQERLGLPASDAPDDDPSEILRKTVTYLDHNRLRMNYPAYRQQGLPITSCLVESLIKQINQRVKGTEKTWNRPAGAEAILQVRAAILSDDDRLKQHIQSRPGNPHYRRSTPALAEK